jgi:hypothetical protein
MNKHKSNSAQKRQQNDFELLRGGTLTASVVRRHFEDVKKRQAQDISAKFAIRQQAAKFFARAGSSTVGDDAAAMSGLLAVTKRLANRKLVPPQPDIVPRFGMWGSYTLRFTPPYTYAGATSDDQAWVITGNPAGAASGDASLGQLNCSVATDFDGESSGAASAWIGVSLRPLFPDATIQVTCDYDITYSWYANSLDPGKEADCTLLPLLELYRYDGAFVQPPLTLSNFGPGLGGGVAGAMDFDFGSLTGALRPPQQASVSSEYFYLLVVSLTCIAEGTGWPGSLAGASAIVTVPSITVTVTGSPVGALPPFPYQI